MRKRSVKRAIIPAAGYGLRLLPLTKAVPKELLPVATKPMIQYAWEEAQACGLKEIVIVIHPEKEAIRKYFEPDPRLIRLLKNKGWKQLGEKIQALSKRTKLDFVYQKERQGLGQAILCCQDFVAGEPFAVLNPDNIYLGKRPCLSYLLEAWQELDSSIVLLGKIKKEETRKVGVAKVKPCPQKGIYLIQDLEEKPGPERAFSSFGLWGRAILEPGIMNYLKETLPDSRGEIQLTDALKKWAQERPLYGFLCPLKRFDTGDWEGLFKANLALLKN
ncbi:MAG: sugar phosphate nucleotidyltransferase [Candidatus Aminicenantes bacterium]|nr:sugar phosphate nucleotidyltransferase [Candidatus Aminicenantes bacterium]